MTILRVGDVAYSTRAACNIRVMVGPNVACPIEVAGTVFIVSNAGELLSNSAIRTKPVAVVGVLE